MTPSSSALSHGRLRVRDDLLDERVVRPFLAVADDRHRRRRPGPRSPREEEQVRRAGDVVKRLAEPTTWLAAEAAVGVFLRGYAHTTVGSRCPGL